MRDCTGEQLKAGDYILYNAIFNDNNYFFCVTSTNNFVTKVKNMEGGRYTVSIPERIKLLSKEEALIYKLGQ